MSCSNWFIEALGPHGLRPTGQTSVNKPLERVTGQFLLNAGGKEREVMVTCPLDNWLAKISACYSANDLKSDLVWIDAGIRPTAVVRAISKLIDNTFNYSKVPVKVRLNQHQNLASIKVLDQGSGIP